MVSHCDFGPLHGRLRALGEGVGAGRNDTDGKRNADKPSSECHVSHHLAGFTPVHGFIAIVTQGNGVGKVGRDDGDDATTTTPRRRMLQFGDVSRLHQGTLAVDVPVPILGGRAGNRDAGHDKRSARRRRSCRRNPHLSRALRQIFGETVSGQDCVGIPIADIRRRRDTELMAGWAVGEAPRACTVPAGNRGARAKRCAARRAIWRGLGSYRSLNSGMRPRPLPVVLHDGVRVGVRGRCQHRRRGRSSQAAAMNAALKALTCPCPSP